MISSLNHQAVKLLRIYPYSSTDNLQQLASTTLHTTIHDSRVR
jgi:hypothetical protein